MASRVIRDTYPTSETVATMKAGAQDRLPRYWLAADDFGCFFFHAQVLRGKLFPLRDDMTTRKVEEDLKEFKKAGLIVVWKGQDGRTYAYFRGWWDSNRRPRPGSVRKTPPPPEGGDPPPPGSEPAADAPPDCGDKAPAVRSSQFAVRSSQTQDPPVAPLPGGGSSSAPVVSEKPAAVAPVKLVKRKRVLSLAEEQEAKRQAQRDHRSRALHAWVTKATAPAWDEATGGMVERSSPTRDEQIAWVQENCHASPEEAADAVALVAAAAGGSNPEVRNGHG